MNDKKISKAMREEIIQNTKEAPTFTREKPLKVGQSMDENISIILVHFIFILKPLTN